MSYYKKYLNIYKGSKIIKKNYKDPFYVPKLINALLNIEIINHDNKEHNDVIKKQTSNETFANLSSLLKTFPRLL